MAGLLKYFRRESKQKLPVLPDLKGNLSEIVPSSSIELTNNIVHDILDEKTTPHGKHEEYLSITISLSQGRISSSQAASHIDLYTW